MNQSWEMGGDTEPRESSECRSCRVKLRPQLFEQSRILLRGICSISPSKTPEEQLELEFPDAILVHLVFRDLREIRSQRARRHGDSRKAGRSRGEQGSTIPDGFDCTELETASL
eukprot:gnl/TRDRNA2_/TRDRNA2_156981_c0_seq2.p1 gnl/TRDRNA2_/TRDRNA2_156981_c0~~gnl/TRDRNA2_/TRDRNA2_156981_c0_seq2.p1  ORF type:complete len:114 (-),score=11.98 gnl/TRDRNA2_/TRDRNA2_156981_c0_seq2:36-377(-)